MGVFVCKIQWHEMHSYKWTNSDCKAMLSQLVSGLVSLPVFSSGVRKITRWLKPHHVCLWLDFFKIIA